MNPKFNKSKKCNFNSNLSLFEKDSELISPCAEDCILQLDFASFQLGSSSKKIWNFVTFEKKKMLSNWNEVPINIHT